MAKRNFSFQKATRENIKARVALIGPSGAGKTYSALAIAAGLAGDGGRVAVIDTENRSARKYSDRYEFDVLELDHFAPLTYVAAIEAAEDEGYDVVVIDSLSHAWMGKGGALEQVDQAAKRGKGNSFAAWREVTPQHNALVDALVRSRCHLVVTMRAKTEYVIEHNKNGKAVPRRVGLAAVQRDGLEYEFDVVAEMDLEHNLVVTKSRCFELADAVVQRPDESVGMQLRSWLDKGEPSIEDRVREAGTRGAERLVAAGYAEDEARTKLWQEAGRIAQKAGAAQRLPSHIEKAADRLTKQIPTPSTESGAGGGQTGTRRAQAAAADLAGHLLGVAEKHHGAGALAELSEPREP